MSDFDLFGNPVRSGFGKKGRPEYEVTEEKRNKVMMLLAAGWTNERIAGAMDITQPTLRKYFISELKIRDVALDRLEAQQMSMLFAHAQDGNVTAIKELRSIIEKLRAAEADRKFDGQARPSEQGKSKPLGKKEAEQQAADDVTGIFQPPAGPQTIQ